ncbi:hypothetical protein DUNSADRAFT_13645 [Dunaliella salina]|uniref:GDSL esterase/lipase n=1 Tax=Dunaliella salina TaxID=3046 RepID=A0ABQ7G8X4_DUNSA|nr:hypothetical protein DUNSADRAFT_13645 [Dunaliella salina]|eukprot:KAF5831059.1 hypothetical protein DUNSADRAFT_13645 [Dunaliella salina]
MQSHTSRWSNGPVWNDYFDESVTEATDSAVEKRVVANYAFGSSRACTAGDSIEGVPAAPKLSAQIQTFLSGQPPLRLNNVPSSGPWEDLGGDGPINFVIAIGSNDFFARLRALQDPSFDDVVELLTDFEDDVMKCVVSGVEQLLSGLPRGQQSTMMVAGLTKIAKVPVLSTSLLKEGLGEIVENAREDYNRKLPGELGKVSVGENTTLVYLDLSSMEDDIKQRARNNEPPVQSIEQLEGRCLETDFPDEETRPQTSIPTTSTPAMIIISTIRHTPQSQCIVSLGSRLRRPWPIPRVTNTLHRLRIVFMTSSHSLLFS